MRDSARVPDVSPETVRTPSDGLLVVSLCPVCRQVELRGRQIVCSAACRRRRSRQRSEQDRQAQIRDVKSLLGCGRPGSRTSCASRRISRRTKRSIDRSRDLRVRPSRVKASTARAVPRNRRAGSSTGSAGGL